MPNQGENDPAEVDVEGTGAGIVAEGEITVIVDVGVSAT